MVTQWVWKNNVMFLFSYRNTVGQWIKALFILVTVDILFYLLVYASEQFISPISRRMANLSFVLWQVQFTYVVYSLIVLVSPMWTRFDSGPMPYVGWLCCLFPLSFKCFRVSRFSDFPSPATTNIGDLHENQLRLMCLSLNIVIHFLKHLSSCESQWPPVVLFFFGGGGELDIYHFMYTTFKLEAKR